ncbi:MAG: hypothetical protein H7263_05405 [Candidatus Sericytochromatia bacterium]|nr:hypothetical protein [Candidatus Sericytochromatia bacterium]
MSTNVSKKLVQIKKVLPTVLTEDRADNYLKGLNFVYLGAQDIYEKSLSALMNGETENCLKFMIFGLDVDRTYTPLLNLCRTMLFGMSDILKDSDYYLYKQKYKELKEAKISLMKKVNDLYNKKQELQSKIDLLEDKIENHKPTFFTIKKLYLIYKIVLRKAKPSIQEYSFEINSCDLVIDKLKKEINDLENLYNLEENIQILKLIVEICTIPIRYQWAAD